MSAVSLDSIVSSLDSFGLSGGILDISNNTGTITNSTVERANLISKGWSITE